MRKFVEVYYWDDLSKDAQEDFKRSPAGDSLMEEYIYDFTFDKKMDIKTVLREYGITEVNIYYNFYYSRTISISATIDIDKFLESFPELREIINNDETLSEDEKDSFWNNFCANKIECNQNSNSSKIISEAYFHTGDSTYELEKAINEEIQKILEENSLDLYKIVMETSFDDILHNDTQLLFTEDGILVGDEEFIYVKYEV